METLTLIRKQPNLYAEISGLAPTQRYRFYNVLLSAVDYGVADKLLLGSDWPITGQKETEKALRDVNLWAQGTNLPKVSEQVIHAVLEENAAKALKL